MKKNVLYIGIALCSQILGVVTGILVVRASTQTEYGLYSAIVGLVAAGAVLSDAGIGSTIVSQAGKRPDDPVLVHTWLEVAARFRRRVGRLIGLGCVGVALFIGLHQGVPLPELVASLVGTVILLEITFIRGVWINYFRVTATAHESQVIEFVWALVRLGLVGVAALNPGNNFLVLLGILIFSNGASALSLRHRALKGLNGAKRARDLRAPEKTMKVAFRHVLPLNLINVLRGQFTTLIITTLGSLAVFGTLMALDRFTIAFVIVVSFLEEIIAPKAVRVPNERILRFLGLIGLVWTGIIIAAGVLSFVLSGFLLSLLGPQFAGYGIELTMLMVGGGIVNVVVTWGFINQARHWVEGAWLAIPVTAIWLALSLMFFDLSTLRGAVSMVATQGIPLLFVELFRTYKGLREDRAGSRVSALPEAA